MNEELIAYLLHEIPKEDRFAFTEKWMSDGDLHEQIQMAEAELFDAYVRGDVGPERRRRIETYLLASPRQQEKLAFARKVHDRFKPAPIRWYSWAAAACIILLAGSTVWLAEKTLRLRGEVARGEQTRADSATRPPFVIALSAPATRGSSPEIKISIPPEVAMAQVELELNPADGGSSLTMKLLSNGRLAWTQTPVLQQTRGPKRIVIAWIPTALLFSGPYEIELSSNGIPVGYYALFIEARN